MAAVTAQAERIFATRCEDHGGQMGKHPCHVCTKQPLFHRYAILSPPLSPAFLAFFILIAFTLDLLRWIEGPIRSSRMLTSLIRALQGPYQARVSFVQGTAAVPSGGFWEISVVWYWTDRQACVSVRQLEKCLPKFCATCHLYTDEQYVDRQL